MSELLNFFETTGFFHIDLSYALMILIGMVCIYLGIAKKYEPLLLVPIGFGIIIGNMPGVAQQGQTIYDHGSVM